MKQIMIILPILLLIMCVLTLANFAYADTKVSGEKVFRSVPLATRLQRIRLVHPWEI